MLGKCANQRVGVIPSNREGFDYQLDRHCSKTGHPGRHVDREFDYQLDRHCSKTVPLQVKVRDVFDYQLDRHCSKTLNDGFHGIKSLITS